jgi:hypothetical protein
VIPNCGFEKPRIPEGECDAVCPRFATMTCPNDCAILDDGCNTCECLQNGRVRVCGDLRCQVNRETRCKAYYSGPRDAGNCDGVTCPDLSTLPGCDVVWIPGLGNCCPVCGDQVPQEPPPQCGENEEFYTCNSRCREGKCSILKRPIHYFCDNYCVEGCFCSPGYLRDAITHTCIPEEDCSPINCGENEEYLYCGQLCSPTCQNKTPDPNCPTHCVTGCFCATNYLYDTETQKCVLESECPN